MDENSNTVAPTPKFDWAEIDQRIRKMEEKRKIENETAREHLLKELRKLKADELASDYDGWGDSGNVGERSVVQIAKDADGNKLVEPVILLPKLQTALENFIWSFAYTKSPGFDNNDGEFGHSLQIDQGNVLTVAIRPYGVILHPASSHGISTRIKSSLSIPTAIQKQKIMFGRMGDMAHPFHHAQSSARKFGGVAADYQSIHD